ncbi:MAG: cytochrome c [Hyphomonadaceae bacterium]
MKIWIVIAAIALSACAANNARDAAAPVGLASSDRIARGREIAELRCAGCHAIGADGQSRMAEAPPFRMLSQRYPVAALEEALAEGILVGHPAMPEFVLSPDDLEALTAYLESVQARRGG